VTASLTTFFGLLGALLVLAFVANRLSKWTRVPDVIVLLITGIALGPVLHWVDGSKFSEVTRGFGTLALILILFAAGLELDLRSALKQFGAGTVLALLSYSLSFVGVSYFCMYALHLALMPSLLVGATLACMSGSVILPVLEQLEMRDTVKTTLVIEASFGDGLGALGVGVLIYLALGGGEIKSGPLPDLLARAGLAPGSHGSIAGAVTAILLFKFLLALAVAVLAGYLWLRLLPLFRQAILAGAHLRRCASALRVYARGWRNCSFCGDGIRRGPGEPARPAALGGLVRLPDSSARPEPRHPFVPRGTGIPGAQLLLRAARRAGRFQRVA
jgi:NhaP-type Na+/H+ or K+/H+ antiporter